MTKCFSYKLPLVTNCNSVYKLSQLSSFNSVQPKLPYTSRQNFPCFFLPLLKLASGTFKLNAFDRILLFVIYTIRK